MPATIDIGDLGPIDIDSFSLGVQHAGVGSPSGSTSAAPTDCKFTKSTDADSFTLVQYASTGKAFDVVTVTFYKTSGAGGLSSPYMIYYLHNAIVSSWNSNGRVDRVGLNFKSLEVAHTVYDDSE